MIVPYKHVKQCVTKPKIWTKPNPIPILFFIPKISETITIKKMEKFRNRNVTLWCEVLDRILYKFAIFFWWICIANGLSILGIARIKKLCERGCSSISCHSCSSWRLQVQQRRKEEAAAVEAKVASPNFLTLRGNNNFLNLEKKKHENHIMTCNSERQKPSQFYSSL